MAAHAIKAGEETSLSQVESTAGAVFAPGSSRSITRTLFTDAVRSDYVNDMYIQMVGTAENVATRWGISRERMDAYALLSHQRAVAAQRNDSSPGRLFRCRYPAGSTAATDDCPRPDTSLEKLAALEPMREGGVITAGNSCPLNDGAAAVLVVSEARARALGLKPRVGFSRALSPALRQRSWE